MSIFMRTHLNNFYAPKIYLPYNTHNFVGRALFDSLIITQPYSTVCMYIDCTEKS